MTTQQFPLCEIYQEIDPALRGEIIKIPDKIVRPNVNLFLIKGVGCKSVGILLNHQPTLDAVNCIIQIKKARSECGRDIGYLQCFCHGCLVNFACISGIQQLHQFLNSYEIRLLITSNGEYAHKSCGDCQDASLKVIDSTSMPWSFTHGRYTYDHFAKDFPYFCLYNLG